jgi:hypothetical protein
MKKQLPDMKLSEYLLSQPTLTEKEIVSILDNKDIWMDGEEVVKRLTSKVKAMQAASNEMVEVEIIDKKKKKASKKTS